MRQNLVPNLIAWYCFQNFVSIKIKILETLMAWHQGGEGNLGTKLYNLHYDTNTTPQNHMHKYEGETVCQNDCIELLTQTLLLAHISMVTRLINLLFIFYYMRMYVCVH